MREAIAQWGADCVVHFAAFAYVGESVRDPAAYYRNNTVAALRMLDVMIECGVSRIVFSSSCATYGIPAGLPITEDMPQLPVSPYGETKLIFERVLADYERAYGLKHVSLRYFNAAGASDDSSIGEAHDPETHIIPLLIDAAHTGGEFNLFGTDYPTRDGSCERDYIHVDDLASAHILAVEHLMGGGDSVSLNIGTGEGVTNFELIHVVEQVTGKRINVVPCGRREGDPAALVASNASARDVLGWFPVHSEIGEIVESANAWYLKTRERDAAGR
jgi:UDP-arabinose 4-epimerase